jgi:glyoxalase family protein
MIAVHGIHHVTAISGDARENLDFYTRVLGLRLVKRSVNQDAPDTYHLFYADAEGRPGSDMTFFPWPAARPARPGAGMAGEVSFAIPPGSLAYWQERLAAADLAVGELTTLFGESRLPFRDPHGLPLGLVESSQTIETVPWGASPVPEARQIRGLHAVRLPVAVRGPSERFLTEGLGFRSIGQDGDWSRFAASDGGSSRWIDLREMPDAPRGLWGTGGVHHVAFRVRNAEAQLEIRERVAAAGAQPTPVIDRFWFRSVYFREPGGVLFEIATDGPGFTADEEMDYLGERLILPPWLEDRRPEIEAVLPQIGVQSPDSDIR